MSLIIDNASMLLGKELTFVSQGFIEISNDGIIKKAKAASHSTVSAMINSKRLDPNDEKIDAQGFLVIPGFINAHTHIGDSIGKDIAVDSELDIRVHPVSGAKRLILQKSNPEHLKIFMKSSAISMMKKGITAFADFREGGYNGVKLLRDALSDLPIKCLALGRAEYYFDHAIKKRGKIGNIQDLKKEASKNLPAEASAMAADVLRISDGFGISGANENTDEALRQYYKLLQESSKHNNKK